MSKKLIDTITEENARRRTEEDAKLYVLSDEINLISDISIRSFVRSLLLYADNFWVSGASWDVDQNPPDEHGHGGMVIHTKRVVRIAKLLCEANVMEEIDQDIIIAAALIHDITKAVGNRDDGFDFDPMYPYTVDAFVKKVTRMDQMYSQESGSSVMSVDEDCVHAILRIVRCHLGQWSPIPETYPLTSMEMILHMADLIATNLHTIIDGEHIDITRWGI